MTSNNSWEIARILTNSYQCLVINELNKLKHNENNFLLASTFLDVSDFNECKVDKYIFKELKDRQLIIEYEINGNKVFRTAHVDLIWRVINLRAYPSTPPRALEFRISYDIEYMSHFDDYNLEELKKIKLLGKHSDEALDIVVRALKEKYPTISYFQFTVLRDILTTRGHVDKGILAPTAAGKTLVFMIPVLVRAVEAAINGENHPIAILAYPRKALAKDQIEKLLELVHTVNSELRRRYGYSKYVTIGLDYGDIRRRPPNSDEPLLGMHCPYKGCKGSLILSRNGLVKCSYNIEHKIHYLYAYKEAVWNDKPHIYVTNIWTLYRRLLNYKTLKLISNVKYIVLDETHVYTGYLGGHLHYIIKMLRNYLQNNRPVFIYSSATVPHPREFLDKLSGSTVDIIDYREIVEKYYSKRNVMPYRKLNIRVYLLPNPNQSIETLTEEAILPITLWCHKLGLKSIVFIDSIAEISTIYDYMKKTILGKRRGREILDHIFNGKGDPRSADESYSWITLLPQQFYYAALYKDKDNIVKWILGDFKNSINIHYGVLSRQERSLIEEKFKQGEYKTLIATSTLELGIDIGDVAVILQHKLPRESEGFIQRIGRAGRSDNCYRISLSFINLQNSPIATLYFFDERLRNKLEKLEELKPLRISLLSESVMTHHLLSLILHKYALKRRKDLDTGKISDLNELLDIVKELKSELDNIDKYVEEYNIINEEKIDIYNNAKITLQKFLSTLEETIDYVRKGQLTLTRDSRQRQIDLDHIIYGIYRKTREILNHIKHIRNTLERGNQLLIKNPNFYQKIETHVNKLYEMYLKLNRFTGREILGSLGLPLHDTLEYIKDLKRKLPIVIEYALSNVEDMSKELRMLQDVLGEYKKSIRNTPLPLLYSDGILREFRIIFHELKDYIRRMERSLDALEKNLEELKDILEQADNRDLLTQMLGVPRYARVLWRLFHRRNGPSLTKLFEEFSQASSIFKFSIILENPSLRITMR